MPLNLLQGGLGEDELHRYSCWTCFQNGRQDFTSLEDMSAKRHRNLTGASVVPHR